MRKFVAMLPRFLPFIAVAVARLLLTPPTREATWWESWGKETTILLVVALVVSFLTLPDFRRSVYRLWGKKRSRLPLFLPNPQPETLPHYLSRLSETDVREKMRNGLHSWDIAGHALDATDKASLSLELYRLFGNDYVEKKELTGPALSLWGILLNDRWSKERFHLTLEAFKRKELADSAWKPSDFLSCSPAADLHDQQWYIEQEEEDRENRIESFVTPGQKVLHRFIGHGVALPSQFKKVWPKQ